MTTRRTFLVTGAAAATAITVARPASAQPVAAGAAVRAAVLEFRDQWTGATGLGELLRRAGVEVVPLDVAAAPATLPVDLIAFGSFTNNEARYLDYVAAHKESLREFVAAGGVVLDLAQSDQFGAETSYLPSTLSAVRADPDHDTIYPADPEHPLVKGLRLDQGRLFTGRSTSIRVSWETLTSWRAMRVLMACATTGYPPCLVEGAHGRGRFLVSSLSVDKCFDAAGAPLQPQVAIDDSAAFFAAVARHVAAVRAGTAPAVVPTPMPAQTPTGPLVGHVDAASARIWARPGLDPAVYGAWTCTLRPATGDPIVVRTTVSTANDNTLIADAKQLRPGTRYDFTLTPDKTAPGFAPLTGSFTTAPAPGQPAKVVMGMGSCAPSTPDRVWTRIVDEGCDSFVMLGDTPYIDSGDLGVARTKHRQFLAVPEVAALIRRMPVWGTWDDHDFGLNGNLGGFPAKRNTRTAFVDYRANATFGHSLAGEQLTTRVEGEGIYTSFRRGPLEVFLIDPRWFSTNEPSWADPTKTTCTGAAQWEWLRDRLTRSTATFKALATGMIWDDKQNTESDDWGTYVHEREAIFDFVAAERIPGVFLIGGDIHVSRALNYGPRVGYDLWQYIVSPLHDRTIPSLNVPHPNLVHSAVEPNVFLKLVADTTVTPATLTATWINRDGRRIFEVRRTATEMGHPGTC
ncbi:alkaline phosphatase D family protein [Actinokineospora sp. HUAS TT18]|uniref:alkaline phosphatase D family protein n=1 Tax=Actinokineospora sp. HUAS TT18 TaxID=3447451 RepID=UPI003F522249